ncbi:MAG TPA: L-histidine N(alpha)-methyltransferase [bacterium]
MGSGGRSKPKAHERLVLRELALPSAALSFHEDVAQGLARTPKSIPPKYFYDATGSDLFERITDTPEYYPTRKEAELLEAHGDTIVEDAGLPEAVVELGSGSARKTRLLLRRLLLDGRTVEYVPIDISAAAITDLSDHLLAEYPHLRINALIGDYHAGLAAMAQRRDTRKLFLFLGSSLGNYNLPEARALLKLVRDAMGPNDRFLLGLDQIKEPAVLHAAYNDAAGVTAAFNVNLLTRINAELGGRFDVSRFQHVAFYNVAEHRIEMHLESTMDQTVRIDALDRSFVFRKGERLHTENSYKYNLARLTQLVDGLGLRIDRHWSDSLGWFSESLLAPV